MAVVAVASNANSAAHNAAYGDREETVAAGIHRFFSPYVLFGEGGEGSW
jgi:hypothetical protein